MQEARQLNLELLVTKAAILEMEAVAQETEMAEEPRIQEAVTKAAEELEIQEVVAETAEELEIQEVVAEAAIREAVMEPTAQIAESTFPKRT